MFGRANEPIDYASERAKRMSEISSVPSSAAGPIQTQRAFNPGFGSNLQLPGLETPGSQGGVGDGL